MTKKKRERNNKTPKAIKYIEVPATSIEQELFREILRQNHRYKNGDIEHCSICGDTAIECELFKMIGGTIICKDCIRIQKNMYGD